MTIEGSAPSAFRNLGSAPTTSPRPPTLTKGKASAANITTSSGLPSDTDRPSSGGGAGIARLPYPARAPTVQELGRGAGASRGQVAQVAGWFFRGGGVDVEAGPPLEAGDAREARHDLDVPVEVD